jgi:hypothetical protein
MADSQSGVARRAADRQPSRLNIVGVGRKACERADPNDVEHGRGPLKTHPGVADPGGVIVFSGD